MVPSALARSAAILALVAGTFAGARFVDAGHTVTWPAWARFTLVSALIFAMVSAVLILHSLLSPEHSGLDPELESDRRGPSLRKGGLVATAVFLLFFASAQVLDTYAGIPSERTFLTGFGLGLAWCTLRKPWWFWGHWKAHFLRNIIGDAATTVIYLAFATFALYVAFFGNPPGFSR